MDFRDASIKDQCEHGDNSDFAVNSEYAASPGPNGIIVRQISADKQDQYTVRYHSAQPQHRPVLALSPLRLNLLAAANGPQVLVFDVEKRRARRVLKGNGRVVTCIAWARDDPRTLATGTADGAICIWSLRTSSRPLYQLRGIHSPCNALAFKSDDWRYLTASHEGSLSAWNVAHNRPIAVSERRSTKAKAFCWSQSNPGIVLNVSSGGTVELLKVVNTTAPTSLKRSASIHEIADDGEASWDHTDIGGVSVLATFKVGYRIKQANAFGRHGLVVLPLQSTTLYFYACPTDHGELIELWRLQADVLIDTFATSSNNSAATVLVSYEASAQSYNVPVQVLDGMGWEAERRTNPRSSVREGGAKPSVIAKGTMRAEPCRRSHTVASRSRLASPRTETTVQPIVKPRKKLQKKAVNVDETGFETSTSRAMTSSLELPKDNSTDEGEKDSPMPFLSPTIPARQPSPGPMLESLDESTHLPPPSAPFDSISTMATNDNDSDSDDETLAADMQTGSSYLPGGVNVPLPRSCGAAFAPNGQLLTFFPARYEDQLELQPQLEDTRPSVGHGRAVTRLFPSFGNLASSSPRRDGVLDVDDDSITEPDVPRFALQPSSFDSRPSWKMKTSPLKATPGAFVSGGTVNISVHDLEQLTPTRKSLATKYGMLRDDAQGIGHLCRDNADSAEGEDLSTTADLWRLLGLLLESRSTPGSKHQHFNLGLDNLTEYRGLEASGNLSLASSATKLPGGVADSMPLSHHPLGKAWAIGRIFAQAEALASIQLLAYMSAILTQASQRHIHTDNQAQRAPALQPLVRSKRSSSYEVASMDGTRSPPGIPILRANSTRSGYSTESPRKRHGSQASSRNASQPGTPYVDSSNSTPPLMLPPLHRQNSRLTASGSVSPEHHRSSFGVAAKNYAASIAEKLSSYGSSPPTKRLGTSPGDELSTSLPDRSTGSWSKTVSFASNLDAVKTDRRSLSLAQEDDNYDSDRTVEDSSLPHTPKQTGMSVVFKTKTGSFFGEEPLPSPEPLLSKELALKGHYWRQCYAEQLRSWDMLLEATELENIGTSTEVMTPHSVDAVMPTARNGRPFVECSVCFCLVQAAEQICPSCLHVTHPACLDIIMSSADAEDFTCPTGCGCHCAAVDITSIHFSRSDGDTGEDVLETFAAKKTPSLTGSFRFGAA